MDAWPGFQDEKKLMQELQKIKNAQLCLQVSKWQVVGLAIPIFLNGKTTASLGVYLPLSRYKSGFQEVIVKELRATGETINEKLSD